MEALSTISLKSAVRITMITHLMKKLQNDSGKHKSIHQSPRPMTETITLSIKKKEFELAYLVQFTLVLIALIGNPFAASANPVNLPDPFSDNKALVKKTPESTEEEAKRTQHESNSSNQQSPKPLDGRDGRELLLRNFRPNIKLKTTVSVKRSAKYPVVDVHTHFRHKLRQSEQALDDYVKVMDRNQIAICCSLDGRLDSELDEHMGFLWQKHRERFTIFVNIDWRGNGDPNEPSTWNFHQQGFAARTAKQIERAVEKGASGLKIFKQFGLGYKNPDGSLIKIDDKRFDPIWEACGRLGIPVIIHTADPAAFFDPIDETNERWEELSRHPDWSFHGPNYPSRAELHAARNRVIERHPQTNFIGAHVANQAEDLTEVSQWLERYPNLWIETASRIAELGRQPYSARDFLLKYQNRIMFGTDGPWPELRLQINWRFFESRDESFHYSEKQPPPQGLWRIHAINLPDNVLRKLYYENASKLIPGVKERLAFHLQNGNQN